MIRCSLAFSISEELPSISLSFGSSRDRCQRSPGDRTSERRGGWGFLDTVHLFTSRQGAAQSDQERWTNERSCLLWLGGLEGKAGILAPVQTKPGIGHDGTAVFDSAADKFPGSIVKDCSGSGRRNRRENTSVQWIQVGYLPCYLGGWRVAMWLDRGWYLGIFDNNADIMGKFWTNATAAGPGSFYFLA